MKLWLIVARMPWQDYDRTYLIPAIDEGTAHKLAIKYLLDGEEDGTEMDCLISACVGTYAGAGVLHIPDGVDWHLNTPRT